MKRSGGLWPQNVKERGLWLRKALQRDILKWHIRALITEIQR